MQDAKLLFNVIESQSIAFKNIAKCYCIESQKLDFYYFIHLQMIYKIILYIYIYIVYIYIYITHIYDI